MNQTALSFLKAAEGCRLTAYPDPGSGGYPWTLGYGRTAGICPGMTCTEEDACAWLAHEVEELARAVRRLVTVELTENEEAALISLVYNIGVAAFERSTLRHLLNLGERDRAADQFLVWDRCSGRVMRGLAERRERERELFLKT